MKNLDLTKAESAADFIAVTFYIPEVSGAGFRNGIQRTVGYNERYGKESRQRVQL